MGITYKEDLEECRKRFVYSFDKEKIDDVVYEIATHVGKNHTIKGYRKGKAPIYAIKNVAKQFILEETKKKLTNEAYAEILFEMKIKAFGQPQINNTKISYDEFELS